MQAQTFLGILFLLAGTFQAFTAILIWQGHRHYILRFANRKVGMVIYATFAVLLFFLAYKNLV